MQRWVMPENNGGDAVAIKAKFSTNPRVVEIQKSLLTAWARKPNPFGVMSVVLGIDEQRIKDIATGKVEPDLSEIIILEANK